MFRILTLYFLLAERLYADHLKANEGLGDLMSFRPVDYSQPEEAKNGKLGISSVAGDKRRTKPLLEEIANHEAFITLLEVIDTARNRKSDLLTLIEDANALMVDLLPFGEDSSTRVDLSSRVNSHILWLRKNLDQTNQVLAVSMQYLRSLYGNVYLPKTQ